MDNLTHSLVGLTLAKTGLERLSPFATTVCLVSANIADADFVALFLGDRWTLLKHHRGITHSIIGTIGIGLLVPLLTAALSRVSKRRTNRRIRLSGLITASLVAAATHPLMDWTNNYGVRPFLPWSSKWLYGDLVFIIDPYIWLGLGGIAFLLTSHTRLRIAGWTLVAVAITAVLLLAGSRRGVDDGALTLVRTVWISGVAVLIVLRIFGLNQKLKARAAIVALSILLFYWCALAVAHRSGYSNAAAVANDFAGRHGEAVLKIAAMPTFGSPLQWQALAETDRAIYRFGIKVLAPREQALVEPVDRFEKPAGQSAQLAAVAARDRRAQVLLDFARFPIAEVTSPSCVGRTLVQFADLRYTEPGTARGNFAVNIPVDCPGP